VRLLRAVRRRSAAARVCAAALLVGAFLGVAGARADEAAAPVPAPALLAWQNPVVPSDFPDPSATRVDGVYWATSTSTRHSPGLPLLRSTDLLHWQYTGTIFRRRPPWTTGPLWAPELIVHEGSVLVYYTGRRRGGPLCVGVASAPAPGGTYTDHGPLVCQAAGSIDATQVRDPAGRPYLVWKEDGNAVRRRSRIWIQRLRRNGIGLIGARHELLRNADPWEGAVIEAPEVVSHDGWLYMFYSGNTYGPPLSCSYALGVARSRGLFGPWERNPANPILRSNSAWRCPGHASPVSDAAGHLFLLYHAYPARDGAAATRHALLDVVTWSADGWPVVNGGQGPSSTTSVP
jgi:xylan 1,4-beta-xylosidase